MIRSEEPTRVCLVTHRWAPSFAGAAHRFSQYLPGLQELGVELDVLCTTAPSEDAPESLSRWDALDFGEVMEPDEFEGSCVYRVKLPPGRSLRRNVLLRDAVAGHIETSGASVTQFLTLEPLRTIRSLGLQSASVRGVFTGTQMWSFARNSLKRKLQRLWIRIPLQRMDHIVVSSVVMREFYESLGVTKPVSVIPNGVDLERFSRSSPVRDKASARGLLGIPAEANVVLFIGSIIHRKGVDLLLDAFARVAATDAQAQLFVVGPRDDSGTEEARIFDSQIEDLVGRSGVADRIHFVGYTADVDTYLRAADVFVLPSRREGMGNVVLEAMAAGVATVLTPYLGLPAEFGEPGEQYVLSAADAASLASSVGDLLQDQNQRLAIGEAGRRWVADHMSMSAAIRAYASIYRDLAAFGTVRAQTRAVSWTD